MQLQFPLMESTQSTKKSSDDCDNDVIGWFENMVENAELVQRQTLCQILELNHGVEYLKKWLGEINIKEMEASALESLYTSLVPLASHADFEPYIRRIADGETGPILTQQPITSLSLSSGTTEGRQKYIPFTCHVTQTTLQVFRLAAALRSRVYPIRKGGRSLEFIYGSKQFKTKGGLMVGTMSSNYFLSKEFKIKQEKIKAFTCSPVEVISSGDYDQSTYCHLLLGLFLSEQVDFIFSPFAYSIVQAYSTFEDVWKDICSDIRQGSLSPRINLPETRKAVLEIISPNPCLASQIEADCKELENMDWFGLIPKLWPNAKYVNTIVTGSMQHYLKRLRNYAGDLAIAGHDYGSSESWIGINVDPCSPPENVTFAAVPTFSYFEFIPLHKINQNCTTSVNDHFIEDKPIPLYQVKVGQHYEIVLTTFTGLYRYRLGDVVEVTGFYKGTPKLSFICRRKLILNINIDKNTEQDLQLVVEKGCELLSKAQAQLVDFTGHANIVNQPGHYIIYWEIKGEVEESVFRKCCQEMDASFIDHGYVVSRKTKSIGPLELCIVERGTFKKILDHFIKNGGALSQFKIPRCTSNQEVLEILNHFTIKRFRSTAYDWV